MLGSRSMGSITFPPTGEVVIVARHSGLTFDIRDRAGELALVQTAGYGGQDNRHFQIVPARDGFYNIVASHSGLSFDVREAAHEMALIQTAGHGGQDNREWSFVETDQGFYVIVARHSNLGLDVRGALGQLAVLQTAGRGGQANREFAILPVEQYEAHPQGWSNLILATTVLSLPEFANRGVAAGMDAAAWNAASTKKALEGLKWIVEHADKLEKLWDLGVKVTEAVKKGLDGADARSNPRDKEWPQRDPSRDIVGPDGSLDLDRAKPVGPEGPIKA